jgi:type 2 lantibiotic biosynthesis protein LanM
MYVNSEYGTNVVQEALPVKNPLAQNQQWYLATTLRERAASIKGLTSLPRRAKTKLSERRFRQWRAQAPFRDEGVFAHRLAVDGLSEEGFGLVIGERGLNIQKDSQTPPSWLVAFDNSFSSTSTNRWQVPAVPKGWAEAPLASMLGVVAPLLHSAMDDLQRKIEALIQSKSHLPVEIGSLANLLYENLPDRLLSILGRTFALELNVARLQGNLQGHTEKERFDNFVKRMSGSRSALALLGEYPVLARLLTECIRYWAEASLEFLQHLSDDWPQIRAMFCPENDPGVLVKVDAGAGDYHNRGRSVIVATFSSGFRVVYKPRSLAVDLHFQELLSWLNSRGARPLFRTLGILNCVDHGWVEFVHAQSCSSPQEVSTFYRRQGGYLALLYALEAIDFHYENLIACGEHPVLLDMEALFHPRIQGFDPRRAEDVAAGTLFYSVLGVGLLPGRLSMNAHSPGIDLSGMGGQDNQVTPFLVSQWEGAGTDEMRVTRKPTVLVGAQNRPLINGANADPHTFSESIVSGFEAIYKLLLAHRAVLLSEDGPIARFAEDEIRVIFRATRTYAVLLGESYHPDVLRDAIDRDRLFDNLWCVVERMPYMARIRQPFGWRGAGIIPSEHQDLWNGDIPRFTTRPGSTDVWSASGERIPNLLDEPGINLARRRLEQLNNEDLGRQLWIIRASLATGPSFLNQPQPRTGNPVEDSLLQQYAPATHERLLNSALTIGQRLEASAVHGDNDVCWIGMATEAADRHSYCFPVSLGLDLYDGMPGVVLFLAYLGVVSGQQRYTNLAEAALRTVRRQIERSQKFFRSIGGFGGWAGIIYVLTQLAKLWKQPALLTEADGMIEMLLPLIRADEHFDMVHGGAGCIVGLLSFYDSTHSARALAAARDCGKRLITRAEPCQEGLGWRLKGSQDLPLTGFSHGAAGVALALLKLSHVTGDDAFRKVAIAAMRYETWMFSEVQQNWPDLRSLPSVRLSPEARRNNFMVAWCNGAAGIGLARLASLPYLDDRGMLADINAALSTTLSRGFGFNHCLCHGDLGNIELLLQASLKLSDPKWKENVSRTTAMVLDSIKRRGLMCGVPCSVESPGLMTGLAGIGYQLLRLAEPARVPSVLLLEAPSRTPPHASVVATG